MKNKSKEEKQIDLAIEKARKKIMQSLFKLE